MIILTDLQARQLNYFLTKNRHLYPEHCEIVPIKIKSGYMISELVLFDRNYDELQTQLNMNPSELEFRQVGPEELIPSDLELLINKINGENNIRNTDGN